ncbi:MAG: type II toxin-antitoxin system RelE/ParE family toxin [Halobacteriota archaeon]|nr:type II toxin-antitoxin system RelE/ParE family toxin [Halobacteriota archaeon]
MKYKVFLERKAQKQLDGLDPSISGVIKDKITKLKSGFSPELDIRKLKGYKNHYRLRVREYRVLFELQEGYVIVIYAILPRRRAYK